MRNPLKPIGKRLLETEKEVQKKHMMDITKNEAIALRVEKLEQDIEFIEDPTQGISERMKKLNKLISIAGWAWGRAADDEYMDRQFTLWNQLMGHWRDDYALIKPREEEESESYNPRVYILTIQGQEFEVEDDISPDPNELLTPAELKYLVVGSAERDFIVAGLTILHRTFKDADVTAAYIAYYQGQQMQDKYVIEETANIGRPKAESRTGLHQT